VLSVATFSLVNPELPEFDEIVIITTIDPTSHRMKMSAWADKKCQYKSYQAAITNGGLFTDTCVKERGENERQSENDCM